MEYCGKITGNRLSKKKLLSVFCGTLAMAVLIGTAYELPELDYEDVASNDHGMMEEMTANPYRPIAGSVNGWNPTEILTQKLDGVKFPGSSLEASVARLKNRDKHISTVIAPLNVGDDLTDILYSESDIAIDPDAAEEEMFGRYPSDDSSAGETGGNTGAGPSADPIVPDTPQIVIPDKPDNIIPDVPDTVIPDVPDTVIPDVPDDVIPDIPDDGTDSDIPDDGTGTDIPDDGDVHDTPSGDTDITVNPTEGFEVNEEGMICRFLPEEANIEDGYLILPNEGCTGIAYGAFDGVGAGICDIEIPDNITSIEDGALRGLPDLFCIWTGEDNPCYTNVDGVLFDRDMTTIISLPSGWIGTYELPASVRRIADYAFDNTNLSKLVMIKSMPPEVGSMAFGESGGNGLVISAPKAYLTEFEEIFAGFHVTVQ